MNTPIKKAVFPVAGIGSRFLPATKASPKEMLPIVDKPLIQYAVEEAISAGINELIFVTSSSKRAIEDHFDANYELEAKLAKEGKQELVDIVHQILPRGVSCAYIRQPETLGLGHAVLCAKPLINHQPFAVLLADDLIDTKNKTCLQQMLDVYQETRSTVIATQEIPSEETHKYGIVQLTNFHDRYGKVLKIVEKPQLEHAPSNIAVIGRYILTPNVLRYLENTRVGIGGEIQLTDAIADLLQDEEVYACLFEGMRYDCGCKLGYLKASVSYALKHPEIGTDFKKFLTAFKI